MCDDDAALKLIFTNDTHSVSAEDVLGLIKDRRIIILY